MLKIIWILLGLLLILLALLAVAEGLGGMGFERQAREKMARLVERAASAPAGTIELSELEGLPEPVSRWLRHSGVVGQPRAALVRVQQSGEFRPGEDKPWLPFEAEQIYSLHEPGFIWLARIRVAPLLNIYVRDLYLEGHGHMRVKLLGLKSLAEAEGEQLDQGALLRFLSEIVWFPQAALADYIEWSALEGDSARATIRSGGVEASVDFLFDDEGRVSKVTAERYREVEGAFSLDHWETPLDHYGRIDGRSLPLRGRAVWHLQGREYEYIRLRVDALEMEAAGD